MGGRKSRYGIFRHVKLKSICFEKLSCQEIHCDSDGEISDDDVAEVIHCDSDGEISDDDEAEVICASSLQISSRYDSPILDEDGNSVSTFLVRTMESINTL